MAPTTRRSRTSRGSADRVLPVIILWAGLYAAFFIVVLKELSGL